MLPAPEIDQGAVDWTAWADDPYPLYRRLRDDAPVFWDEPNQTFVLTRYDDVYPILLDHRRFSSVPRDILEGREPPSSEIRQQDQPRHTFIRGIVAPLFNPGAMRRREEIIREIVRGIVDATEGSEVVEISSAHRHAAPGQRRTRADRAAAVPARALPPADGRAARVPAHPRRAGRDHDRGAGALRRGSGETCGRSLSR